jgi:peptide chain release factor subunit 3
VTEDQNLSEQAQRGLNLGAAPNLNPSSLSFRPGAATFQPQQYQQYAPQQQAGYAQGYNYGAQYPQYGGYSQQPQYGQGMYQQQPQYQQQTWSQTQPPPAHAPPPPAATPGAPPAAAAPKVKVLSIGAEAPKAAVTKTLTIDSPAEPAKPKTSAAKPDGADKPAASKAGQTADRPQNADDKPSAKPTAKLNADAVAKEQTTEVDEETLAAVYGKVSALEDSPRTNSDRAPGSMLHCVPRTRRQWSE